jgi:MFS family permease
MAHRWILDLTPLRTSQDLRRLFIGQTVSMIGSQLTVVAIAFQVYSLTGSSFQVGAVSLAQLVPFVMGALAGGALGDAIDRKRVLVIASSFSALASAGLAVNATTDRRASVLALYLVPAAAAGLSGVVATVVTASVPSLVASDLLTPAYATMQVIDQVGMVIGPALAGLVIAEVGLPLLYGLDALTFCWAALFLGRMTQTLPARATTDPGLRSVLEGFRYLRGRQDLEGAYLLDLCATVFGLPRALFPALAHSVFRRGPAVLGLLYAAPAVGALVGSLTSGWLGGIRRQGRAVIMAVAAWGTTIVAFGYVSVLWAAVALLVFAGWADLVSAVLRSTIVQSAVAEPFRSRISSLQMAVVEGGPRLGDLESGAIASAFSTQFSVVSGGVVCVIGALAFAVLLPKFRRQSTTARPSP